MPTQPQDSPASHPGRGWPSRALNVVALVAVLVLGLGLAHHSLSDQDLFLHDRAGRAILAGDGVPSRNAYSFTAPDHRWVDHEWLFEVLVAACGHLGGHAAIASRAGAWNLLRIALTTLLLIVLLAGDDILARRRAWLLLPALGSLAMLWTRLTLRPELISYILLVAVWRMIERTAADAREHRWRDLVDPRQPAGRALVLTVLWAQCHGFYAMTAVLWLLIGLPAAASSSRGGVSTRHLALVAAALSLVCGLFTPALVQGLLYPWRALSQFTRPGPDLQATISELVPLLHTPDSLGLTIRVTEISVVWGLVWIVGTWGRVPRARIVLWAATAALAFAAQRNLAMYALAFYLLHAGVKPGPTWLTRRRGWPAGALSAVAVLAGLAIGVLWLGALTTNRFYLHEGVARRWGGGLTPANFPLAQADQLHDGQRVANNIDAASTIIAAGTARVCIDGRTEAYPARAWADYAIFKAGGDGALAQLGRWHADGVVLAHRNPASHAVLTTLLHAPTWRLLGADDAGVLLVPGPADTSSWQQARSLLQQQGAAFAATLPASGVDVRAADRCAAWASLLQLAGLGREATDILQRGRRLAPEHPAVLHNLGNQLMAQGDLAGARDLFLRAARLNPRAAGALVNAGVCTYQQGDARGALKLLKRATRIDPRRFEAWASLAEVARAAGDARTAARAYQKALALRDDPRLRARAQSLGRTPQ